MSGFKRRGIYFHDGFACDRPGHAPLGWDHAAWERQIRWLHACGIDTIEFATMLEFNRVPSTDLERRKIADRQAILQLAHELGMEFGYLLTNTVVSTVPYGREPGDQLCDRAVNLCPRVPGNFERSLANALFYIDTYRNADFFEEFAADWGGCTCGQCGVPDYLRYVRALAEAVPDKTLYANTWCISYWGPDPVPHGWRNVFDQEIVGTRAVIAALETMPENVGLGLPCHHLYRPLCFDAYGGRANTPRFPTADDLASVRAARCPTLAWTHFVVDDDPYRPRAWGIVHSEVRYLRALLQTLRDAGIDAVMGNLYLPWLQLSNTFAFGQLLENPDRDPRELLAEFARLVAHPADADALTDVLVWLDNHSYWREQLPIADRLPPLPSALDRDGAARLAATIRPNSNPPLPLPITPDAWLAELRHSIGRMDWTKEKP